MSDIELADIRPSGCSRGHQGIFQSNLKSDAKRLLRQSDAEGGRTDIDAIDLKVNLPSPTATDQVVRAEYETTGVVCGVQLMA